MKTHSNKPDAANPAMTRQLQIGGHFSGVAEPELVSHTQQPLEKKLEDYIGRHWAGNCRSHAGDGHSLIAELPFCFRK